MGREPSFHYIAHLAIALRLASYTSQRLPWSPFGDVAAWSDENVMDWLVKTWAPAALAER